MIINFKRKTEAQIETTLKELGAETISADELAAMEVADEIKLEQQEQRRQVRARGEKPVPRQNKSRAEGNFLFIRFSDEWADRLPGGLWKFAVVLQRKADYGIRFKVTMAMTAKAGVDPRHRRRYLEHLEKLELIVVEWSGSRSDPWVTVQFRGASQDGR
jgi:hypothetical protein